GIGHAQPREDVFRDKLLIRQPAARLHCRSDGRHASEIVLVTTGRRDVTEQLCDRGRALGERRKPEAQRIVRCAEVLVATLLQEQRGAYRLREAADLIGGERRRLERTLDIGTAVASLP